MSRKLKLIWDFRGPASAKTAEHHEIHLKEYIAIEKLPLNITGFEVKGEMQAIAFMVVTDEHIWFRYVTRETASWRIIH
jgi:head-tail adaptor